MKKFIVSALLAVGFSGAVFAAGSNDIILGFRATGGTGASQNLQVNLGSFSLYKGQEGGTSVTITNLLTGSAFGTNTIDSIYGSSWNTRSDILWGAAGTIINGQTGPNGEIGRSLYAGAVANGSLLDGAETAIAYNRASATSQSTPSARIAGMYALFAGNTVIAPNASDFNTWSTQRGATPVAFGSFAEAKFENTTNITGNYVASDLYEITPGPAGTPSTFLGTLAIFANGDVTFTSAIPEPSTYAMILGAAVLGFVMLRRRQAMQQA